MRRLTSFALCLGGLFVLAGCAGTAELKGLPDETVSARGTLLSSAELEHYSWGYLDAVLTDAGVDIDAEVGVTFYKLTYATIDVNGNPTVASGAVMVPDSATTASLISYQHSTATEKTDVPTGINDEALFVAAAYASSGNYVVSAPDYLGLGSSTIALHPYVHAASEASASLDMLRATKQFIAEQSITLTGKLFLSGYSQGGHATMALTQTLQNMGTSEFTVTASAPGAGPYDLSDSQMNFALDDPGPDTPTFLAYVTLAYNSIYGLYTNPNAAFIPPYDTQVPPLFNGSNSIDQIAAALPDQAALLFQPAFMTAMLQSGSAIQNDLTANNLYNWKPTVPMTLYHARSDNIVAFENSEKAFDTMKALGATTVKLVDLGGNLTHVQGIEPTVADSRTWFDSLN